MKSRAIRFAALATLLLIVSACASLRPAGGGLERSLEVARMFEGKNLPSGYTYYYSGILNAPDGIMGIKEGWTLETTLWKPVDPTPAIQERWIWNFTRGLGSSPFNRGAWIVTPAGEKVGIWYSRRIYTHIWFKPDHRITVQTPDGMGSLEDLPSFGTGIMKN